MDSTVNLDQLSASQEEQETRINELMDAASPATLYGRRASTCTGLVFGYYGGAGPFNATAIANGTVTCGASTTTYVVASRSTGAVSSSTATTNWNNSTDYARLYSIVSGGSAITSYQDHRMRAGGALIGGAGGSGAAFSAVTTQSGTSRDIENVDAGLYLRFTNSSAKTCTFQPDSTEPLDDDVEFHIRCVGTGNLTLTPGSGVTLNAPSGGSLVLSDGMTVTVKRVAADEFDVIGQTEP